VEDDGGKYSGSALWRDNREDVGKAGVPWKTLETARQVRTDEQLPFGDDMMLCSRLCSAEDDKNTTCVSRFDPKGP
jgi:hypothetical protein